MVEEVEVSAIELPRVDPDEGALSSFRDCTEEKSHSMACFTQFPQDG